jgi:hypothetical protein
MHDMDIITSFTASISTGYFYVVKENLLQEW